jgi:hypothetical protein
LPINSEALAAVAVRILVIFMQNWNYSLKFQKRSLLQLLL